MPDALDALYHRVEALEANLRAATDLVQRAEKMIPGFGFTWMPIILSDTAEARARAEAAENRADDLAHQLLEAENLLAKYGEDNREITAFLTRKL